jgi:hypothetical protein
MVSQRRGYHKRLSRMRAVPEGDVELPEFPRQNNKSCAVPHRGVVVWWQPKQLGGSDQLLTGHFVVMQRPDQVRFRGGSSGSGYL